MSVLLAQGAILAPARGWKEGQKKYEHQLHTNLNKKRLQTFNEYRNLSKQFRKSEEIYLLLV